MEMLQMQQVGRHYYDPKAAVFVPQHKLEIWPGFISAINHFDDGPLLTLDVSHKVRGSLTFGRRLLLIYLFAMYYGSEQP